MKSHIMAIPLKGAGKCLKLSEIKIAAQNVKERNKYHSIYKRRYGWANLKKIKTGYKLGF